MSPKKKPASSFQTIKLVGKKAQELLDTARTRVKESQQAKKKKGSAPVTQEEGPGELVVHLSIGSVVKAAFAILGIVALVLVAYHIRDKILLLLLAIFLSVVIDPGVSYLEKWGLPRGFAILLVYILALTLILFLVISLIPIIAEQIQQMAVRLAEQIDIFLADPTFHVRFLSDEIGRAHV